MIVFEAVVHGSYVFNALTWTSSYSGKPWCTSWTRQPLMASQHIDFVRDLSSSAHVLLWLGRFEILPHLLGVSMLPRIAPLAYVVHDAHPYNSYQLLDV